MFLTRQALRKIRLLVIAYLSLGILTGMTAIILAVFHVYSIFLVSLSILCFLLAPFFRVLGRYTEGKGKLINDGNKMVYRELRPADFIRLYEEKRNCQDNVIVEEDFDVLRLLVTAYDVLGQTDHELEVLDKMIDIAPDNKKVLVFLLKSSVIYDMGQVEKAEQLFYKLPPER